MSKDKKTLTGNFGAPVDDDQNSLIAGLQLETKEVARLDGMSAEARAKETAQ